MALTAQTPTRWLSRTTAILGWLFVALLLWRIVEGKDFGGVHLAAAMLLIASLGTSVASHGWPERLATEPGRYQSTYRVIVVLMAAGLPILGLLKLLDWEYAVIVVEWWEIGLFAAFWIMETIRRWTPPNRSVP